MQIADGVTLTLVGVLPLAFLSIVPGFRKSRLDRVARPNRVPSTMIEMQMGVDDNINVIRREAGRAELIEKLCRLTVDLYHLVWEFVANAGFDQNIFVPAANQN